MKAMDTERENEKKRKYIQRETRERKQELNKEHKREE
jgi:hypothetical protein